MIKKTLILLTFASLLLPPSALADTGLTISPTTIELMLAPNKTVIQNITLKNATTPTQYQVSLHQLIPLGQDGGSTIDLAPLDHATIPYVITFDNMPLPLQEPLSFAGDETRTYTLRISSASADKSSTDALALALTPIAKGSLSTQPIVAIPLLFTLTPDGVLDFSFDIVDFDLPTLADSLQPLVIAPRLNNTGSFMHRPQGELLVGDALYEVSPELILGGTTRTLRFTQGEQTSAVTLEPNIKRLGPTTITLAIKTVGGTTIIENTRVVWFCPYVCSP